MSDATPTAEAPPTSPATAPSPSPSASPSVAAAVTSAMPTPSASASTAASTPAPSKAKATSQVVASPYVVTEPALTEWNARGGPAGVLGMPIGPVVTGDVAGGSHQDFVGGAISWSPATGVHATYGAIHLVWTDNGGRSGVLGYPTQGVIALRDGGSYQDFQHGAIYSSSFGTWLSTAPLRSTWIAQGFEHGTLGYPAGATIATRDGGVYQMYEGGEILAWHGYVHATYGPIRTAWTTYDAQTGAYGFPLSDVITGIRDGGSYQSFQGGEIYSSVAGAFGISGAIRTAWQRQNYEHGLLGYPTGDPVTAADGSTSQTFEGGAIVAVSGTAYESYGPIRTAWLGYGAQGGVFGRMLSDVLTGLRDGGSYQTFSGGEIYASAAGALGISGQIRLAWQRQNYEHGPLGYPTGDPVTAADGSTAQTFEGGIILLHNGIAHPISNDMRAAWLRSSAQDGPLGFPVSDVYTGLRDGGSYQSFEGGEIYSSSGGAFVVTGAIRLAWQGQNYEHGQLGYPTSDPSYSDPTNGQQTFQGGTIHLVDGVATIEYSAPAWYLNASAVSAADVWATYRIGCPVTPSQLTRIRFPYWSMGGGTGEGEMIVASGVAAAVGRAFEEAYKYHFPVQKVVPVEAYGGSDVASMQDGNSSAFNCRTVTGNPRQISQHSYGNAVDVNTFQNPYVTGSSVYPAGSETYLDRAWVRPGMIEPGDPFAGTFANLGWYWGARWASPDYQHFSSNGG